MAQTTATHLPTRGSVVRAVWIWSRAIPLFVILGIVFLILRCFFRRRSVDRPLKWGCRVLIRTLGIHVGVEGMERIDPERPYTFMFNHVTVIDHIVFYGVLPHFGHGVEATENFRIPFYGWVARAVGNYPISRDSPEGARELLERCAREANEQGFSVFCAPEGTRSTDGVLRPFKNGVFRFALDCDREIVPLALIGLQAVLPMGEWRIRPQPVTVRILEPVPLRDSAGELLSIVELSKRVRQAFCSAGLGESETTT